MASPRSLARLHRLHVPPTQSALEAFRPGCRRLPEVWTGSKKALIRRHAGRDISRPVERARCHADMGRRGGPPSAAAACQPAQQPVCHSGALLCPPVYVSASALSCSPAHPGAAAPQAAALGLVGTSSHMLPLPRPDAQRPSLRGHGCSPATACIAAAVVTAGHAARAWPLGGGGVRLGKGISSVAGALVRSPAI